MHSSFECRYEMTQLETGNERDGWSSHWQKVHRPSQELGKLLEDVAYRCQTRSLEWVYQREGIQTESVSSENHVERVGLEDALDHSASFAIQLNSLGTTALPGLVVI